MLFVSCELIYNGQFIDPNNPDLYCNGTRARQEVAERHGITVQDVLNLMCLPSAPDLRELDCFAYIELNDFGFSCDFAFRGF